MVLKLEHELESPGRLLKTDFVTPPRVSDSVVCGWGQIICISKEILVVLMLLALGPHFRTRAINHKLYKLHKKWKKISSNSAYQLISSILISQKHTFIVCKITFHFEFILDGYHILSFPRQLLNICYLSLSPSEIKKAHLCHGPCMYKSLPHSMKCWKNRGLGIRFRCKYCFCLYYFGHIAHYP